MFIFYKFSDDEKARKESLERLKEQWSKGDLTETTKLILSASPLTQSLISKNEPEEISR